METHLDSEVSDPLMVRQAVSASDTEGLNTVTPWTNKAVSASDTEGLNTVTPWTNKAVSASDTEGLDAVTPWTKKEIRALLCDMDNDDIKCGLWHFKPQFLQFLAKTEAYLVLYCLVGVVMGMFFTYTVSVISTIEKRFELSSKQTGIMLAGNDVSQVMLSMLITYFGNHGNRPNWMGFGVVCASVSCFIAVAPHLIYGAGEDAQFSVLQSSAASQPNNTASIANELLCPNLEIETCDIEEHGQSSHRNNGPVIILFISQFFVGIAISSYYSIGLVYLDDNVNKKDTPIYYGISMIVRVMGPVMGFFLGSKCLAIWIDPSQHPDISEKDPRWLGAWWLGFVILGVMLAIVGFVLFFFPKQLPSSLAAEVERIEKLVIKKAVTAKKIMSIEYFLELAKQTKEQTKPSLKKLPKALRRLATNKVWLGNSFNSIVVLLAYSGYWSFNPKYLESQFHKSASDANFFTGIASLVASVFGILLGGVVLRWKQPGARLVTGYSVFITFVSSLLMLMLMFVGCSKIDIQGFGETCSSECECSDKYLPVCAETGQTFYSACIAGCTGRIINAAELTYTNCSCIESLHSADTSISFPSPSTLMNSAVTGGVATQGYCEQDCNTLPLYIILTIITKMIGASGRVGGTIVFLRCVAQEDKALALGTLTVLISLFSFIPGPIIMGALVDSSCLIWDTECNEKGNCWLYDSDRFRVVMHLFTGALMFLSILGDIVAFIYSKDLKLYEDHEEELEIELDIANLEETARKYNLPTVSTT